jgi:integrase
MAKGRLTAAVRDNDIPAVLQLYRPAQYREPWFAAHVDEMRALIVKSKPKTAAVVQLQFTCLSRLYQFGAANNCDMNPKTLLSPEVLEWFITSHYVSSHPQTRATVRSNLRRIGLANNAHVYYGNQPERQQRRELAPPYETHHVSGYLEILNKQKTESRSRFLDTILHLGLGAGLRGTEMRLARPEHVTERAGLTHLHVQGRQPRSVPIRRPYAEAVLRLAETSTGEYLMGTSAERSQNAMSCMKARVEVPEWLPRLSVSRLRTTWMVDTLSERVEAKAFLEAAGVRNGYLGFLGPYLRDVKDRVATDHALAGVPS